MPPIGQTIRDLLGGVSQKPKYIRASNQGEVQENALDSPVKGKTKRPPSKHVAKIATDTTGYDKAFVHTVNRSATERYRIIVANGSLQVIDADTGVIHPVITPKGTGYLSAGAEYRATTVGDTTFLVNRSVITKPGVTRAPAAKREALLFVRQADFSTTYTVTLDGKTVSIRTVDMAHASSRVSINTTNIASDLRQALSANSQIDDEFLILQYGSTLYIKRNDGADFSITTEDGLADNGLKSVKGSVQVFDDLPRRAPNGFRVEVSGDEANPKDSYWVQYSDEGKPRQDGVWRECPAPDMVLDFDAATLPWLLTRRGKLLSNKHRGALGLHVPVVTTGGNTEYVEQWSLDGVTPVGTDIILRDNLSAIYTIISGPLSGENDARLRVNYDIDTTLVEPGITVSVALEKYNAGTSAYDPVDSRSYAPGVLVQDEYFQRTGTILTGDKYRLTTAYSTGVTPDSPFRRAYINVHGPDHPTWPGVRTTVIETRQVDFGDGYSYPAGSEITLDVSWLGLGGIPETFTVSAVDGPLTSADLPALFVAEFAGSSQYTATLGPGNSIYVGVISGFDPKVAATVAFDSTKTFYNPTLALTDDEYVGKVLKNLSDGSQGVVVSNTATTVVVDALTGGKLNRFSDEDECVIEGGSQEFVFAPAPWVPRGVGNDDSAPMPSFLGNTLSDVFWYSNRLGLVSGESVVLSGTGDAFDFFRETVRQLLDSDPIDLKAASTDVAVFDHATMWNKAVFLFSASGHQFKLWGEPVFSPRTARLDGVSDFAASGVCKPLPFGSRLFFTRAKKGYTQVMEYFRANTEDEKYDASDSTTDVPKYLTGSPRDIAGDANLEFLAVLTDDGSLYVHTFHDEGQRRVMHSWSKWAFPNGTVLAIDMNDGVLDMLVQRADGVYLETVDVGVLPDGDDAHADREGNATTEAYTFRYVMSALYPRDRDGLAQTTGRLQLSYLRVEYHDTCDLTVTVKQNGRADRVKSVTHATPTTGFLSVPVLAQNEAVTIEITSAAPVGCSLASIGWEGTFTDRSRRV